MYPLAKYTDIIVYCIHINICTLKLCFSYNIITNIIKYKYLTENKKIQANLNFTAYVIF